MQQKAALQIIYFSHNKSNNIVINSLYVHISKILLNRAKKTSMISYFATYYSFYDQT